MTRTSIRILRILQSLKITHKPSSRHRIIQQTRHASIKPRHTSAVETKATRPPESSKEHDRAGAKSTRNHEPHVWTWARRAIIYTAATFLSAHIFVEYFYTYDLCDGVSMLPTIAASGDWVLISKRYRRGRGIRMGDVVSFKHPHHPERLAIKRVLGMPGDFVLHDMPGAGNGAMLQVPQGHCWVVGDNMAHSRDSRLFGPLPLALVQGKVTRLTPGGWIWKIRRMESALFTPPEDDDVE